MTASILHETLATPVAELAQQPGEALHRLQLDAGDLLAAAKAIVEHIDRAVDLKYVDRAHQLRLAASKDTGVVHFDDGNVRVTADLPKKVEWDQKQARRTHRFASLPVATTRLSSSRRQLPRQRNQVPGLAGIPAFPIHPRTHRQGWQSHLSGSRCSRSNHHAESLIESLRKKSISLSDLPNSHSRTGPRRTSNHRWLCPSKMPASMTSHLQFQESLINESLQPFNRLPPSSSA
jgi:hypothetical protein